MICPIAQDLAAHSKYVLVMHPQLSTFFRCVAGLNASPGFFSQPLCGIVRSRLMLHSGFSRHFCLCF